MSGEGQAVRSFDLGRRSAGVLLHPTSLPDGRLGKSAYRFVDWLAEAGQAWWQVLPLGPPDAFGSPYTSSSAFAAWRGLLAEPDAPVSAEEAEAFRNRHSYWAWDWERYAGEGAIEDQVRFEREWSALRSHAARRGVRLIGDIPIYVAAKSADTHAHPELFEEGVVAGAAPDAAHPGGQLWGQPVYDWKAMREAGYRWWTERIRRVLELVDCARIDHFRGFVAYWTVPEGVTNPREGSWRRGPGAPLFRAIEGELGGLPLIAEDLGLITPAVDRLRAELGIPGMRILCRSFMRRHRTRHAISAHPEYSVVYTGTHDHATLAGWWEAAPTDERKRALGDLRRVEIEGELPWALVRLALSSRARLAILPMQDVLELGDEARMNEPGTYGGRNWRWRLDPEQLTGELARRLRSACAETGRATPGPRLAAVRAAAG